MQYGEIRAITMASKGTCAFIQFAKRASAEVAAEQTFNKLVKNKFTAKKISHVGVNNLFRNKFTAKMMSCRRLWVTNAKADRLTTFIFLTNFQTYLKSFRLYMLTL